eukprot:1081454-Pleurochrysis_carterae.AAC.2
MARHRKRAACHDIRYICVEMTFKRQSGTALRSSTAIGLLTGCRPCANFFRRMVKLPFFTIT